ncbi:hypothetical protein GWK47_009244 [Chionoecetes opilio]|uniref:Protein kinase domain-containing protein n=1 Tax=Chionoecetes opilio TaxID=41210 RepID=A0A8J4XZ81_CHIOP|nr:hypothetical protein GWK47_009244 [Chionoecetes opilio]
MTPKTEEKRVTEETQEAKEAKCGCCAGLKKAFRTLPKLCRRKCCGNRRRKDAVESVEVLVLNVKTEQQGSPSLPEEHSNHHQEHSAEVLSEPCLVVPQETCLSEPLLDAHKRKNAGASRVDGIRGQRRTPSRTHVQQPQRKKVRRRRRRVRDDQEQDDGLGWQVVCRKKQKKTVDKDSVEKQPAKAVQATTSEANGAPEDIAAPEATTVKATGRRRRPRPRPSPTRPPGRVRVPPPHDTLSQEVVLRGLKTQVSAAAKELTRHLQDIEVKTREAAERRRQRQAACVAVVEVATDLRRHVVGPGGAALLKLAQEHPGVRVTVPPPTDTTTKTVTIRGPPAQVAAVKDTIATRLQVAQQRWEQQRQQRLQWQKAASTVATTASIASAVAATPTTAAATSPRQKCSPCHCPDNHCHDHRGCPEPLPLPLQPPPPPRHRVHGVTLAMESADLRVEYIGNGNPAFKIKAKIGCITTEDAMTGWAQPCGEGDSTSPVTIEGVCTVRMIEIEDSQRFLPFVGEKMVADRYGEYTVCMTKLLRRAQLVRFVVRRAAVVVAGVVAALLWLLWLLWRPRRDGGYGAVWQVAYKGKDAVVKKFKYDADRKIMLQETRVMLDLEGAGGAPRLLAVCQKPLALVQEFVGKTYDHYFKACSIHGLLNSLASICQRLNEVHAKGFVHNDSKANNITYISTRRRRPGHPYH